jgi:hypothetical protein
MILFILVGIFQLITLIFLWNWDRNLRYRENISHVRCYTCITGGSVSSFASTHSMCTYHRAHWQLIHDLEEKNARAISFGSAGTNHLDTNTSI